MTARDTELAVIESIEAGKAACRVMAVLAGVAAALLCVRLATTLVLGQPDPGSLSKGYWIDELKEERIYAACVRLAALAAFLAITPVVVKLVYWRRQVDRVLIILAGYAVACIAASLPLAFVFLIRWAKSVLTWSLASVIAYLDALYGLVLIGSFLVAGFALLPALAAVAYAEWNGIRSALFYAAAGALVPQLVGGVLLLHAGTAPAWIVLFGPSGLLGGLTYWAVAGRTAGGTARHCAGPGAGRRHRVAAVM